MQKVLVTGASGFLGKYIVSELQNQYEVHTVGRQSQADYINDLSLQVPLLKTNYPLVVHAAGKAHMMHAGDKDAPVFFEVNTNGTKRLCDAFDMLGSYPEQFVFISSVSVYGLMEGEMITENQPLSGTSTYAKSKIEAESFLLEWCAMHSIKLSILRLPLIAGANPPGNLGAMINAIKTNRYFTIGNGDAKKSMVMADDIAKWMPVIAANGGIYHLTDGYHPSFAALSLHISKQLHKKKPLAIPHWLAAAMAFAGNFLGKKAPLNTTKLQKITATLTFDDSKARQAFGWNPQPVLEHFIIN